MSVKRLSEKEAELTKIIAGFEGNPPPFRVFWRAGSPVEVLLNACASERADLLILGAHQKRRLAQVLPWLRC
jgi:nucleotide-binding universal stress UspA family protein